MIDLALPSAMVSFASSSRGTYADLFQQKMPTLKAATFNSKNLELHIRDYETHVDRKGIDALWLFQSFDADLRAMLGTRFEIEFPTEPDQGREEANAVYVKRRDESTTKLITAIRKACLLYTSPSPRDATLSRMPSSA